MAIPDVSIWGFSPGLRTAVKFLCGYVASSRDIFASAAKKYGHVMRHGKSLKWYIAIHRTNSNNYPEITANNIQKRDFKDGDFRFLWHINEC